MSVSKSPTQNLQQTDETSNKDGAHRMGELGMWVDIGSKGEGGRHRIEQVVKRSCKERA